MVPDFKVSTETARTILPQEYSKRITYESVANTAFLINAFNNSTFDNISLYLDDKLHQPYRINLINNGKEILEYSKKLDSFGEFISGSGPTLIALIKDNSSYISKMKKFLTTLENHWKLYKTKINTTGVEIQVTDE